MRSVTRLPTLSVHCGQCCPQHDDLCFLKHDDLSFPKQDYLSFLKQDDQWLLEQDDLILAVIAHELAHIEERHSLHQIMEVVGIAAIASVLFGSTDSLLEEASAVAVDLWASKKSRHFEKEADLVALDYLDAINLKRTSFALAIQKLMQNLCNTKTEKSFDNCLLQGIPKFERN